MKRTMVPLLIALQRWGQVPLLLAFRNRSRDLTPWGLVLILLCTLPPSLMAGELLPSPALIDASLWVPSEGSAPASIVRENDPAVRFPCAFSSLTGWRTVWDVRLETDLKSAKRVIFQVRADDPDAVAGLAVYFRSGQGWYTVRLGGIGREWTTLTAARKSFGTEGEPKGWDRIDALRFCVLPAAKKDTAVYLRSIASTSAILASDLGRLGPYGTLDQMEKALGPAPEIERARALQSRLQNLSETEAASEETRDRVREVRQGLLTLYASTRQPRTREFRAAWCHSGTGPSCGWTRAIESLSKNGIHAVFPNLLWGGIAYYPSKVVPPPAGDPRDHLQECLDAGRKYGVAVHVWKVCWQFGWMSDPGTVAPFRFEDRMAVDRDGRRTDWLCPSRPENRKRELDAVLDIVRRYPVDGIHLDYIRYESDRTCFCLQCRKAFVKESGRKIRRWPEDVVSGKHRIPYADFRRGLITSFVRDVRKGIDRVREGVKLSVAVFPNPLQCRDTVLQDWPVWVQKGLVDFVCPMNYTGTLGEFQGLVRSQKTAVADRVPLVTGIAASLEENGAGGPDMVLAQIEAQREMGAEGFILFELDDKTIQEILPLLKQGLTKE